MLAGDVYQKYNAAVASSGSFDMSADTGTEIIVHNITVNPTSATSTTELQFFDGTNYYVVDTITGNGAWMGMFLHCKPSQYYRVKPTDATGTKICCDGVYSKA